MRRGAGAVHSLGLKFQDAATIDPMGSHRGTIKLKPDLPRIVRTIENKNRATNTKTLKNQECLHFHFQLRPLRH